MSDMHGVGVEVVSDWRAAERAAAQHMREVLMLSDVRLTGEGTDNGVDVTSREATAQVKWYSTPVGIAEVQRLRGTTTRNEWALFYASRSGYTQQARIAALKGNVALFVIGASGIVEAVNSVAESYVRLRHGLPQQEKPGGTITLGALMATTRRRWELERAIREYGDRLGKLCGARDRMQFVFAISESESTALTQDVARGLPMWPRPTDPDKLDDVRYRYRRLSNWLERFPEESGRDPAEVIAFLEASLVRMPALIDEAIEAVPVPRAELNAWCDYWTDDAHRASYRPRKRLPRDPELRDLFERRAKQGPDASARAQHNKLMELRVVQ